MKLLIKHRLLFCLILIIKLPAFSISIHDARRMPVGTVVTITGVALNGSEFGNQRFIDDGTDAICVFSSLASSVNKGDEVTLTGTIEDYHSLIEVINLTSITINSTGKPLPDKAVLFPYQLKESYESRLVQLRSVTISGTGVFNGNTAYTINDGISSSTLYIKSGTSMVGQPIPSGRVNITGIGSQYDDTNELFPRTTTDITSTALYIDSVPGISAITSTGFTIHWNTNASSSTLINYGLTNQLEIGTLTGSNGTAHSIALSGTASTVYYFQCISVNGNDTALSPIMMGITASPMPGDIKVYFNRTVNNSVANPAGNIAIYTPNSFDDTIASLINSAQQTIDISIYSFGSFNNGAIITAINNAYQSGKTVRIIYDGNNSSPGISQLNNNIQKLASPLADYNYNICHHKFVIIDAALNTATLITGSTNFTDGQLNDDANNLVIIRDQSMAKVYTMEFEEMWGSNGTFPDISNGRFGYYKRDNTPHAISISGTVVHSYFSPSDNINYAIRNEIQQADNNLYISLLLFTKSDIGTEILNKINSGINFAGIVNDTSGTTSQTIFNNLVSLAGNNMQLYNPASNEILHHKYLIADQNTTFDPVVLTGSHNWSYTAEISNDENTLIIHDAAIANQFYQEFHKRMQDNGIVLMSEERNPSGNSVFPVPASQIVYIQFTQPVTNKISVFNISGLKILEPKTTDSLLKIDISSFPDGIYFLQEEGKKPLPFIVQHQ